MPPILNKVRETLMRIIASTKTEYTPEWNDNKDNESPVIVEHLTPTLNLYNELIGSQPIKLQLDKDGKMDGGEIELSIDTKKIVKRMVTKIRNLIVEVDGKEITIKDSSDLFGPGIPSVLSGLVDELGNYLQGLLSEKRVDPKN